MQKIIRRREKRHKTFSPFLILMGRFQKSFNNFVKTDRKQLFLRTEGVRSVITCLWIDIRNKK